MNHYNYIFAGGGCAALSTALYMSRKGLQDQRVLIIDQDDKTVNDRTWCFWSSGDHPFQDIVYHSWPQLSFVDPAGVVRSDMGDYTYHLIRGIDFYQKVKAELKKDPNVCFLTDKVENIYHVAEGSAVVWTTKQGFTADLVLNSIFQRPPATSTPNDYNLLQHFTGWWIETDHPQFDEQEARLMDFSVEQKGDCRFMYVLPVSKRKALIEYTIFSGGRLPEKDYQEALKVYIEEQLQITGYRIYEQEQGCIPMTNLSLSSYAGKNILPIGTAAGWVKPSTGYAFMNIQKKSKLLGERLLAGKSPAWSTRQGRFSFYDNLLLHILAKQGGKGKQIFTALFRNNPLHRILTFLNEQSTLKEEVFIFGSLPVLPFLSALWQRTFSRIIKTEKPFFFISGGRTSNLRVDGNSEEVF